MQITKNALQRAIDLFDEKDLDFIKTDPELAEILANFALDEVINEPRAKLDEKTRFLSLLAVLLGCQGKEAFKIALPAALKAGLSPIEIKEVIYQGCAYLGIGRVLPFLKVCNKVFKKKGIELPLESQKTVAYEERVEKGNGKQVEIFGEHMKGFENSGPKESQQINYFLAGNCFGDYYTRKGLTNAERELITFCYLYAQGGCEPQLTSHAAANLKVGNSKEMLIAVLTANIPYIGYPRTLNALRCVNEAAKNQ